jgi:hypothetical protein
VSNHDEHVRRPTGDNPSAHASDNDVLLQQVRAVLTPMPPIDRRAIANILSAVAERRPSVFERMRARLAFAVDQFRYATSPLTRVAALAATCLTVGFVARGVVMRDTSPAESASGTVAIGTTTTAPLRPQAGSATSAAIPVQPVNDTADPASALVPVQFVLDARVVGTATTVSVVGDFNEWNIAATPMTLERGAWSVSLPTTQGRHVYAFVIDGERWIADPRAPRATDTDFGRPGSVIIVQTP